MNGSALWALFVLFAINTMNFFDRQILGAVAEEVKQEFKLNDTQLGALGTAFTLLYAFVGVPLGILADRVSRRWILSVGVAAWSLLTAASGLARSFTQLFVIRLGVGVGEASCAPAATSLIGDLFPFGKRGAALSVFMMGLPLGLASSFLVGAALASRFGWRTPFFFACIPGLVCAALVLWIREPRRGASDSAEPAPAPRAPRPGGPSAWSVLAIPTVWWLIASGAIHNFNMYAIGAFFVPMLRRFHELDLTQACWVAAFAYVFSGIPGLLLGGWVADGLRVHRVDGRLIVGGCAILAAIPLTYFAVLRPQGDVAGLLLLFGTGCAFMYVYYSSVYATLQDVVRPQFRATAMALYFFAMYVLGASLGPFVTGYVSDHFALQSAAGSGIVGVAANALPPEHKAQGVRDAMFLIPALNVALAAVLFAGCLTVRRDVERARAP